MIVFFLTEIVQCKKIISSHIFINKKSLLCMLNLEKENLIVYV
jgi:hypothetical protein